VNQQTLLSRSEWDAPLRDYRRGVENNNGEYRLQNLWHFDEKCEGYPSRNFTIRKDRPSDDDLCNRCARQFGR